MKNRDVYIITGPTASGKTKESLILSKKLDIEIICADSMQIYKGYDIITNKPSPDELSCVKHHLINALDGNDNIFSVYEFEKKAKKIIEDCFKRNKTPVVVGGTGLYLDSLIYNLNYEKKSKYNPERNLDYNFKFILLLPKNKEEREALYKDINDRVDEMFLKGIEKEAKTLYDSKIKDNFGLKKAIGYKEFIPYFNNETSDIDLVKEEIKKNTRHYAKRQITWMKKYLDLSNVKN